MSCTTFLDFSLDHDWDEPMRRRAAEMLAHLESCPDCQAGILEDDRIRQALGAFQSSAEPPDGWDNFERRLDMRPPHSLPIGKDQTGFGARWLAIAASLLIAMGGVFEAGRAFRNAGPATLAKMSAPTPAANAVFAPPELRNEVSAFRQVSQVFDGRAGWMLVSDEANDVGVTTSSDMPAHQLLLLRLTLAHGGESASDADLLVVPGQSANLTLPLDAGRSLHYRIVTSSQDPTRISVWLAIKSRVGAETLAALSRNLQLRPGQKTNAGNLTTSAGAYELKIGFASADLAGSKP